jgi:hypothetical protein
VGLERGPLSLVRITEELFEWKSSGSSSRKLRLTAVGICCADHAKVGANFADMLRLLSRYSSLAGLLPRSLVLACQNCVSRVNAIFSD